LVQAPTTLLAMADASVGGKVAIDHPLGKNLIGVFKQPVAVIADLGTLATLPPDEVANGMAEIVKAAIIGEAGGDDVLLRLLDHGAPVSDAMLDRAIAVKQRLVEADPYEAGERALLNLGHTFGHALERLSGYTLKHGFAVAQGMMAAAHLAEILDLAPGELTAQTAHLLDTYGLATHWGAGLPPDTTPEAVLAAMSTDKKRRDGRLRFVLARAVGDVRIEADVPPGAVLHALAASRG
ncbi:MAG TPA: 3-dehydroquinate synthase family protein, partial [Chloroflexia bacterium]|nr:3-dehydroquinate synthase family protein [Chloroflexia bacterium]